MDLQIARGLAQFNYIDYYAILGVTINAPGGEIRKRYLKIARSLHPDSCTAANKQLGSQLLSKLVNPAYEKLMPDRERSEQEVLLRLLGQRVIQEKSIELKSERALQLLQATDPDNFYTTSVRELAAGQYQELDQVLERTGELSELNLAYLVAKESQGEANFGRKQPSGSSSARQRTPASSSAAGTALGSPQQPMPAASGAPPPAGTFVSQYYRRAEEFLAKNNLQQAILELRDALKLEPSNSRCHGLLGTIYLRQNQMTMGKVHINQALKLDPKNSMALTAKQQLDKLEQKSGSTQKQGGGLFGLFGGKKK